MTAAVSEGLSQRCLDVYCPGGACADGTPVLVWPCQPLGTPFQTWTLTQSDLRVREHVSGKCLEYNPFTCNASLPLPASCLGVALEVTTCSSWPGQQWNWSSPYGQLTNLVTGLCADVYCPGGPGVCTVVNGNRLQLFTCQQAPGAANQAFTAVFLPPPPPSPSPPRPPQPPPSPARPPPPRPPPPPPNALVPPNLATQPPPAGFSTPPLPALPGGNGTNSSSGSPPSSRLSSTVWAPWLIAVATVLALLAFLCGACWPRAKRCLCGPPTAVAPYPEGEPEGDDVGGSGGGGCCCFGGDNAADDDDLPDDTHAAIQSSLAGQRRASVLRRLSGRLSDLLTRRVRLAKIVDAHGGFPPPLPPRPWKTEKSPAREGGEDDENSGSGSDL
jgi:hypothetical protein